MNKLTSLAILVGLVGCTIQSSPDSNPPAPGAPSTTTPSDPNTPAANTNGNNNGPTTSTDPMAPAPTPAAGMAMVRAIHASPDAPKVDVYVKGNPTPVVTGLSYGQTSGWIEVPKGSYTFELRAAPSKASDPIAYATGALMIDDGQMISAIAAGLLGSTDADSSFRIVPLAEMFGNVPSGKVRVRAVHAGADAPTVDLDVGNDAPSSPEIAGLTRFSATDAAGVALPAGQNLAIGIDKDATRVTSFTTPKLPDGGQLLVIATGLLSNGFSLLAVGPSGAVGFFKQDPIVYALHAGADAPAVDIFAGDAEIVSNVAFGQLSKPIQVQPGSYELAFYGATTGTKRPDTAPAAQATTGNLAAGERYLAVATGLLANKTFNLVGLRDGFTRADDKSVLRLVHGSPDAPAVDTGLISVDDEIDPVLFPDLSFGKSSNEAGLAAAPGHLYTGVAPSGDDWNIVQRFTVPALAGLRAFVVASGTLDATKGKSFRLLVVDTAKTPWAVSTVYPH